jgi:hypothetical protein
VRCDGRKPGWWWADDDLIEEARVEQMGVNAFAALCLIIQRANADANCFPDFKEAPPLEGVVSGSRS